MDKNEIVKGIFVRKAASLYLVKKLSKTNKGFRLEYFYRSTKDKTGILHLNGYKDFYESELELFKTPTIEHIEIVKSKIKKEDPDFLITSIISEDNYETQYERVCIEYLKERGYLIYKPI